MSAFTKLSSTVQELLQRYDDKQQQDNISNILKSDSNNITTIEQLHQQLQTDLSLIENSVTELAGFVRRKNEVEELPGGEKRPRYGPSMRERITLLESKIQQLQEIKLTILFPTFEATKTKLFTYNKSKLATPPPPPPPPIPPPPVPTMKFSQSTSSSSNDSQQLPKTEQEIQAIVQKTALLAQQTDQFHQEQELSIKLYKPGMNDLQIALQEISKPVKTNLCAILQAILKNPEKIEFRTLSLQNKHVQTLIEQPGVRRALIALGFIPKKQFSTSEEQGEYVIYYMNEPNLEVDFDTWSTWFNQLKSYVDVILM
jgi:predicted transcriptional regulator